MPRPNQTPEKRRELLPIVAQAFAELGYRRATTAELAQRCGVQENILYRLWPDKKAMFIAAITHVYEQAAGIWKRLLKEGDARQSTAERLLAYESQHHGEFGHYRIVFAGLSETDDPEIHAALADMYLRYHRFIRRQIVAHRDGRTGKTTSAAMSAWAIVGLGTVANISRELGLIDDRQRRRLFAEIGQSVLNGGSD